MSKFATMFAVTAVAVLANAPASAQRYTNYPFCAVYSLRTETCAFMTFAQCQMTVSGRGGYCTANPYYQPARRVVKRKRA